MDIFYQLTYKIQKPVSIIHKQSKIHQINLVWQKKLDIDFFLLCKNFQNSYNSYTNIYLK